jgi:hypothetical protein
MSPFDAINHAMSAISTGGFSTSDQSLAKWTQPAVHWVAVVIMILGSLPFTLYVATLRGNRKALIKDQQVQGLLGMLLVTWLVLGTWYWWTTKLHWLEALRHVALNVTSVVTTTGFALGDYSLWGNFSLMLFFYLGFVGGCSGSTAGGIKIFRFQVAYILLKANLNQLIHPRAVIKQKYNGHRLDEEIVRSILTFSFFFAITICVIALLLSLLGVDWMTALTGAASTVSGVGPGLVRPSARRATSPPCRMPPSGSCRSACCSADWRSLRCLCVYSSVLASLTGACQTARYRRAWYRTSDGAGRSCSDRRTPAGYAISSRSCSAAPDTARPAAACRRAMLKTRALLLQLPLQGATKVRVSRHGSPCGSKAKHLPLPRRGHAFRKTRQVLAAGRAAAPWLRWGRA